MKIRSTNLESRSQGISILENTTLPPSEERVSSEKSRRKKGKDQEKLVIAASNDNLLRNIQHTREARSMENKPAKKRSEGGRALHDIINLVGRMPNAR